MEEQQISWLNKKLKEADTIKTRFIQDMQHDLRTPTSGMVVLLDELARQEVDQKKREKLTLLYQAAKKVHEICNEIIDFERIVHDPLLKKKFSIQTLVRELIELNQPAAIARGLSLDFKIRQHVPDIIKGDPKRVSRLLLNLVGNAIKFTEQGSVLVDVKLIREDSNEVVLQFEVRDTGIGIPSDKKEIIYEQFMRVNPSNEGYYKGSGLGLNIVKRYTDELGGEIDLETEIDQGTTFYVTLPFKKPLTNEIYDRDLVVVKEVESFPQEPPPAHPTFRLLLIEDDPLARMAALCVLDDLVCDVGVAKDVAEAERMLNQKQFDLIISDLGLPDGSGNEIVQGLKDDPGALNHATPCLALTAHSDSQKKMEAKEAGFLTVMTKPLTKQAAHAWVEMYVQKKAKEGGSSNTDDDLPIIDMKQGTQLASRNPQLAVELLDILCHDLPSDLIFIEEAYQKNDIKMLRDLFHKLKGGLCYCGVPRLRLALNILHDEVREVENVAEIQHLFDRLYEEVNLLLEEHKKLI